jgi:broad specificity polyphosphatase/5'/3'-nucleotidase SurE
MGFFFYKFSIIVKIKKKKKLSKMSKNCHKVVKKMSKSCQNCQKKCQKNFPKVVKSSIKKAKIANFEVEDEMCGRIIIIRR